MDTRSLILALDYGGSKHTAAILAAGERREWLARERLHLTPGANAHYHQSAMLGLAHSLLQQTAGRLVAVGVSFGGPVDSTKGIVHLSHHASGWEGIPLRDRLQAAFGVPVQIDNDANAGALGEWKLGAGMGCVSLLYVTVSTGIGGGWVFDGKIFSGADGMAGEIGHMVIQPSGAHCPCGKRGCLEAEAAGPAIARKFCERTHGRVPDEETGESVAAAAQQGNVIAQQVMDEAALLLGRGLGSAVNLLNPQRIVMGGGVTKSGNRWWEGVRKSAESEIIPPAHVDIMPATLGDEAPLWGAAALTGFI